jgi:uncharacterized peroxidase-related enzyme
MAFIKTIPPEQAQDKLAEIYQRVKGPGGQVDNVLQVHSLRPHSLQGHMAIYKSVLHHSGNQLPKWFLESVGVLVSHLNGCDYCEGHHSAGLKRLLSDQPGMFPAYREQLNQRQPGKPFTTAQIAALEYARKLTQTPGEITQTDIDRLRDSGLSDGEILEVNQVASYFSYANRTVSGLGVNVAGETLGLAPKDSSDPENWNHQ